MRPVLISAGATRNPVDAIRYLSAHASGRTGVEIGRALQARGAAVRLLGSPEACLRAEGGLPTEPYGSTRDLMARMLTWLQAHPDGVVIHSAAVGDYEVQAADDKLPSGREELVLRLRPTPKILDALKPAAPGCRVVSFKAASPETTGDGLVQIARAQLRRTGSDLVFANTIGQLGTTATLVDADDATAYADRGAAITALIERVRGWL